MAIGAVTARIITQYSDKGSKAAARDINKLGKNFDKFAGKVGKAFGLAAAASAAATTSTGSVTLSCVKNSDPSISLTLGLYAVGSVRGMKDSVITNTDVLSYQLYQPSSLVPNTACTFNETTAWGITGTELFDPAAATSIAPQTYNICGKILPGQDVANGSYQDTVTAQVDF